MGKTIFITGASSGIGRATAELFAERGWHVLATMRNPEKAGALATMPGVEVIELDVTDSAGIDRVCADVLERHDVDVLFNNAGYGLMAPLEKPTEAQIRQLFDTDVMGTILVTQRFIGHFKSRRAGHVLTTTSLAAIIAFPRDAIYGAAKRAQQGMMESLYYELKPFGVSVKCIIPGGTNTGFKRRSMTRPATKKPIAGSACSSLTAMTPFPGRSKPRKLSGRQCTTARIR